MPEKRGNKLPCGHDESRARLVRYRCSLAQFGCTDIHVARVCGECFKAGRTSRRILGMK